MSASDRAKSPLASRTVELVLSNEPRRYVRLGEGCTVKAGYAVDGELIAVKVVGVPAREPRQRAGIALHAPPTGQATGKVADDA